MSQTEQRVGRGGAGRRLRVLHLIKGLGTGGAERLLVTSAAVADHDRFEYEVAYLVEDLAALAPDLEKQAVTVHCLGARDGFDLRWTGPLRRLLLDRRFDVVHVHSPAVTAFARVVVRALPRSSRPALLSTDHNVWPNYAILSRLLNAVTFPLDDAHLAVSEGVARSIPPVFRRHVEVMVQGIPVQEARAQIEQREEIRASLGIPPEQVVATTVANFRPEKGYLDLLEAAHLVLDRGVPVLFLAAGHGHQEAEILQRHAALDLGDRFRFLGFREDAVALLAASDLYVMASHQEGFPLTLMEALAVGLPSVATTVGGAPSALQEGVEGFLVPPGRPELLAERIAQVAGDAPLRRRMAAAAWLRGEAYDIRHPVAHTEALYRRLVEARRR